jgi:hypothetical protein
LDVQTDDIVKFMRDVGGEVVVDVAERGAEGGSLFKATFDKGLGIVVKHPETVRRKSTHSFQAGIENHVPIGGQHMWFCFVQLSDLCDEMKMFERSPARFLGAMKVGIAEQPEVMDEGMKVVDEVADGVGGLVTRGGEPAGDKIPLLEDSPISHKVPVQQRVGTCSSLAL